MSKGKVAFSVSITRRHIRESITKNARRCAIARAIVESDPDISNANATKRFIAIARHSTERVDKFRTPKLAEDFITEFDEQRDPKPFRLTLTFSDYVSTHPRQMRQGQKAEEIERRKVVARATGRSLRDVHPEEAPPSVFGSDGFALPVRPKVKRAPKPSTAKRSYAKRETAADQFNKLDSAR